MNKHVDAWPTNIFYGEMKNKKYCDEIVKHIFENCDAFGSSTFKLTKKTVFGNDGILYDGNEFSKKESETPIKKEIIKFVEEIVDPLFNEWTLKNLNKKIKDFNKFRYKVWMTSSINDSYTIMTHNHSGSQLSGVFYLINEELDKGGEIVFYDPRFNANRGYSGDEFMELFKPIRLTTESYKFVIFPSFLYHETTPFTGKMRIAIVVDLFLN